MTGQFYDAENGLVSIDGIAALIGFDREFVMANLAIEGTEGVVTMPQTWVRRARRTIDRVTRERAARGLPAPSLYDVLDDLAAS